MKKILVYGIVVMLAGCLSAGAKNLYETFEHHPPGRIQRGGHRDRPIRHVPHGQCL